MASPSPGPLPSTCAASGDDARNTWLSLGHARPVLAHDLGSPPSQGSQTAQVPGARTPFPGTQSCPGASLVQVSGGGSQETASGWLWSPWRPGQRAAKPIVPGMSKGWLPGLRPVVTWRVGAQSALLVSSARPGVGCRAPRGCRRECPRELGFGRRPKRPNLLPAMVQACFHPQWGFLLQGALAEFAASQGSHMIPQTRGCRLDGEPVGPAQGRPEPSPTLPPQSG